MVKIGNINKSLKFGKLKQAYVSRGPGRGLLASRVRFVFNGGQIAEDDTADTLGLVDGDIIDVTVEREWKQAVGDVKGMDPEEET